MGSETSLVVFVCILLVLLSASKPSSMSGWRDDSGEKGKRTNTQ